jgi:hypothetical protein
MFLSLAINFVLSALAESVKNPRRKEELRQRLLELRDAITQVYGQ